MNDNSIPQAQDPAVAPLRGPAKPAHRILVVEDEPFIRQLNTDALLKSGYHADAVEDGAVAWEALQLKSYHLIITDNDMPKVTGVDLLKKLHAAHMALPVIMATGTVPTEEFTRNPWLQPAATLIKPYTIDELLGTVQQVLRVTEAGPEELRSPASQNQPSTDGWQL